MPVSLTSKQKKALRGIAQNLREHTIVGKQGITPLVIRTISDGLTHESLVKVRILDEDRVARAALAGELASTLDAVLCGSVGKTVSLYRPGKKSIPMDD